MAKDLNGSSFDNVNLFSQEFRNILNSRAQACGKIENIELGPNLLSETTPSHIFIDGLPQDEVVGPEIFPAMITDSDDQGSHSWIEVSYPATGPEKGFPVRVIDGRFGTIKDEGEMDEGPAREIRGGVHVFGVVLMYSAEAISLPIRTPENKDSVLVNLWFQRPATMFPVLVKKTGGEDGDGESPATYTYEVTATKVLGNGLSPLKPRPNGKMWEAGSKEAGGDSSGYGRGIAFWGLQYKQDMILPHLELWDVTEKPVTFECKELGETSTSESTYGSARSSFTPSRRDSSSTLQDEHLGGGTNLVGGADLDAKPNWWEL